MRSAGIGQIINSVHFSLRQRFGRRILDHEQLLSVGLCQTFSGKGICIGILYSKAFRIVTPGFLQLLPGGQLYDLPVLRKTHRAIGRPRDPGNIPDGDPCRQRFRNFRYGMLSHAVGNDIRLGIQQHGGPQAVRPVVIVRQPPQAGLNASCNDRHVGVGPADPVAVHNDCAVRPQSHLPARRIGIRFPVLPRHGIMVYHGIHVSGRDQKPQPGTPEFPDGLLLTPVRLGQKAYAIAQRLQQPCQNGRPEGRMIHICVTTDINEIHAVPAARFHFASVDRKKILHGPPSYPSARLGMAFRSQPSRCPPRYR